MAERLWLPMQFLREHRQESEFILRIGAAANAIAAALASFRALGPPNLDQGLPFVEARRRELDRLHTFIVAASYLSEASALLEPTQPWRFARLALDRRAQLGSGAEPLDLAAARESFRRIKVDVLQKLRNVIGFHWDRSVFGQWLDLSLRDHISVWIADQPALPTHIYRAAADAVAFEVANRHPDGGTAVALQIVEAMQLFLSVAQLVTFGWFLQHGLLETNWDRQWHAC